MEAEHARLSGEEARTVTVRSPPGDGCDPHVWAGVELK